MNTHTHLAQLYQDPATLLETAARFIGDALARGEAAVVIAVPENRAALESRLRARSFDPSALSKTQQLVFFDAQECLAQFMVDGMPDGERFQKTITPGLQQARRRFQRVAAFGEMVNVLWEQGRVPAAIHLEELWNTLIAQLDFPLLCGYRIDALTAEWQDLRRICQTHTHVDPVEDARRFEQALQRALVDVFGDEAGRNLWNLIVKIPDAKQSPSAAVLFWLREKMPTAADSMLIRARQHYSSPSTQTLPFA